MVLILAILIGLWGPTAVALLIFYVVRYSRTDAPTPMRARKPVAASRRSETAGSRRRGLQTQS
jgi:hypothetical protein